MSLTRSDLTQLIEDAKLNPMAVQKAGIEFLEKVRGGEVEIVDASNAFVYLGEFASTLFVNAIRGTAILGQRTYPELGLTRKDLYHHMASVDYIDTFASPSRATLAFCFNKAELISKSVPTGNAGMRKLVLGRNTQVMAGGIPFTFEYPIEIRVLSHGGLQIVYDNSRPSPLSALEDNNVAWSTENYTTDREDYIKIDVPVSQMEQKSFTTALSASKVFNKSYPFNDQFYYCRVYTSNDAGGWDEIKTTHSDQVFNPLTPTAVLQVLDNNLLNVSIPQVYYSTGLVTRSLRVDIFTTKGPLELALNTYTADQFVPTWRDLDKDDGGLYTAPINTLVKAFIVATEPATGGTNWLSVEELKERIITNSLGPIDLPITNVQIQSQLKRLTDVGFSCVTDIDNSTKRLYVATRELPAPDVEEVSTGMGSNVVTLMKTADQLLAEADTADNGERITILPTTLYKNEGGYLSIVDQGTREYLASLTGDNKVDAVTSGNYLYTPFHYVYDFTNNVFSVRPYYFGSPAIKRRFFVEDNGTLGVGVSSSSHNFLRTDTGWKLQVSTNSTDTLKDLEDEGVVAQLAFTPEGEVARVYLNGTLIGRDPTSKEWIFEFDFGTTWDVDPKNSLYLTGFQAEAISPHPYPAGLTTVFDIFYAVQSDLVEAGALTSIDSTMGKFLYPNQPVTGLYHEQVTLAMGDELSGLWARARSTIGEESYLRYEADVPRRYTDDKFAKDEQGNIIMERDAEGNITGIKYEHRVGDTVYLDDGSVDLLYRQGQIILQDGQPLVKSPRTVQRQVELCLFDGVYFFATAQTDVDYKDTVPEQIVTWVNTTLAPVRKKLLELTDMKFHPKATIGLINTVVDSGESRSLEAAQRLAVVYYVSDTVSRDEDLKTAMRKSTRTKITELFKNSLVTLDKMMEQLKTQMGDDIIGVKITGLGGAANFSVVSMVDDSARLCIAKKLVSLPNGTFSVEDDIDIDFKKHTS